MLKEEKCLLNQIQQACGEFCKKQKDFFKKHQTLTLVHGYYFWKTKRLTIYYLLANTGVNTAKNEPRKESKKGIIWMASLVMFPLIRLRQVTFKKSLKMIHIYTIEKSYFSYCTDVLSIDPYCLGSVKVRILDAGHARSA